MSRILLSEAFKGWQQSGFFGVVIPLPNFEGQNMKQYDLDFFSQYGDRTISSLVDVARITSATIEPLTEEERQNVALVVGAHFYDKWERLNKAFLSNYELLDNVTENTVTEDVQTTTYGKKSTEQIKNMKTDTDDSVYAFNSDTAVPSDSSSENTNGETTNTDSGKDVVTNKHTVKRHGNIGVTSSQQMITQEIVLRNKYNLMQIIIKDTADLLTIQVYA